MSQGVLLSLLQQLGSDLAGLPSGVLPWIREAALALDPQVAVFFTSGRPSWLSCCCHDFQDRLVLPAGAWP